MSVSPTVENLDGLKRRLDVTIPSEQLDEAYQQRLTKVAKTAKIDGFRSGKVPAKEIERRYGPGILHEVAQELIQKSLVSAFEENKLAVAGAPDVKPGDLKKGEPLKIEVNFEVYPDIALADMSTVEIEKITVEVGGKNIDTMLEQLCKQQAEWAEVDRASVSGDKVSIDFVGKLNGDPFENGSANDFELELGSKQMIPGFEEGIIGSKPGDVREIKVTFPEEYPKEELAGQDVAFDITVHKVLEAKLPEADDKLAEKVGVTGGIEALKEEIAKSMTQEVERMLRERIKKDVLDRLIEHNEVEIPNALIDQEIEHLQKMTRQQMQEKQKISEADANKVELPRDQYEEQARKRVVLGLLLGEVIKTHTLTVDSDKVRAKVEEIASTYHDPEKVISWYYSNKRMLSEIESVVLEDQAVEKLLEMMQVKETVLPYDEALKLPQQDAEKNK